MEAICSHLPTTIPVPVAAAILSIHIPAQVHTQVNTKTVPIIAHSNAGQFILARFTNDPHDIPLFS